MEGTDGGSIFVGVVTNLADAAKIEIMLNEVDWAVNDASTRVITVAANINRDPFILTILAADGIHIALRGQFQCMKAALKNGILTPVSIGLWEEDGLYMICSNHVENEDVFAVVGSSCLWEIFEPIEMITLVSKQKREEAAQSLAEEAIRGANMKEILEHLQEALHLGS
ncbi:hypothetical protein DCAR_0727429 [Daucus carota subsp. sativus]|uniref:Uncharacterized protein n=1 Tax=Daucus carota subsp. sativus TaxID=79200 RepID=A0A161Y3M2_DAUCS|nr:hypothetical protein DCAR_0727429 [Daucus carota subsp. sativus]